MVTYLASEDADTLDGIFRGDKTDEDSKYPLALLMQAKFLGLIAGFRISQTMG